MLPYSHVTCTSCSRVVLDHSCISVSPLMWVRKWTWYHLIIAFKKPQRSNNAMHISKINAWHYLCLHIFHSAWTGTLNQPVFNASCSIMHFLEPHVNWALLNRDNTEKTQWHTALIAAKLTRYNIVALSETQIAEEGSLKEKGIHFIGRGLRLESDHYMECLSQ